MKKKISKSNQLKKNNTSFNVLQNCTRFSKKIMDFPFILI